MTVTLKSPSFMIMVVLLGVFTAVGNRLVARDTPVQLSNGDVEMFVTFSF